MTARRVSASADPDLALPKGESRAALKIRADVAKKEARQRVRAEAFHLDYRQCRRCAYRHLRFGERRPRELLLMTDDPRRLAHAHEVVFRSLGGSPLDIRIILTICFDCHEVLQRHREDVVLLDPALGTRGPVEFVPREAYGTGTRRVTLTAEERATAAATRRRLRERSGNDEEYSEEDHVLVAMLERMRRGSR